MPPKSGDQFVIKSGGYEAVITEVGATIRSFTFNGMPVLDGFELDELAPSGAGQVLAPWPNRLDRGRYDFNGVSGNAALNEPEYNNAIHGLVRFRPFEVLAHDADAVHLSHRLLPEPAYPFFLRLELTFTVSDEGLVVSVLATNEDTQPVPFGIGFHPYLSGGPDGLSRATLALPARSHVVLNDRSLPIGIETIDAFPSEGRLSGLQLDDCFSALEIEDDHRWHARFCPDTEMSRTIELWADAVFGYAMCFTGDALPKNKARRALALEPMTCPPNALATGTDLIVIEHGETFTAKCGILVAVK